MSFPYRNTGSLCSSFLPDRLVSLPVKRPYAITLCRRLPIVVRAPLEASVTLLEATTPVKLPAWHCPTAGLRRLVRTQYHKGGIPTATPHRLASMPLRLPPILYMHYRVPVPNWSKAPWGLSVLAQVTSIFTGIAISPDALLRQRSNHYAFRAGRNLPDMEFRYLRTVIVTAAVYWGLNSKLRLR